MGALTIRPLTVRDTRHLAKLLKRLVKDAKQHWIETLIVPAAESVQSGTGSADSEEAETKYIRLFTGIMESLIETYEGDVTEWFASLCGVSVEDYLNLPFATDLQIIEQVKDSEAFKDFFSKACAMFKSNERFGGILSRLATLSGFTTDSPSDS